MKALSIRQPWAWAIMRAGKDIENRTWRTNIRGTILVHASKGLGKEEYEYARDDILFALGDDAPGVGFPSRKDLCRGCILGTVEVVDCVDCVEFSGSPWFYGPVGFVLANPKPFAEPIPCSGALGFWNYNGKTDRRLT